MKITITIEDKKKSKIRIIKIPISKEELSALFGLGFMIADKEYYKLFKLNKINKPLDRFFRKVNFALNDVVNEGKIYSWKDGKSKLLKERWYLVKKPKWSKLD